MRDRQSGQAAAARALTGHGRMGATEHHALRRHQLVLVVVTLAVQAILLLAPQRETGLVGDQTKYDAEARAVAAGAPLPPTFLWPPLYGRFVGGLYALFGPRRGPVTLVQIALLLASLLLFQELLETIGVGRTAALLACALLACDPQLAAFTRYLWPEVVHLFLSLLAVWLLIGSAGTSSLRCLAAGLVLGLAVLVKSLLGPFLPVLAVAGAWAAPTASAARRWGRGLLVLAGAGLVVGPVVVNNGVRYGTWRISSAALVNVWIGLNDPEDRHEYDVVPHREVETYLGSSAVSAERDRILWTRIRQKVESDGWARLLADQAGKQYGRLFDRESFFTDQLPGGRWSPSGTPGLATQVLRAWAYAAYALLLALASLGLFQVRGAAMRRLARLPLVFLVFNLGIFLLLHVKTRYRLAFLPCLAFFAALAVDRALAGRAPLDEPRVELLRLAAGVTLAALVLGLAFGA